jgi:short-subunit dehydrogenase
LTKQQLTTFLPIAVLSIVNPGEIISHLNFSVMDTNQYVLITGAASGFGKEFALIFAREGYNLILVDNDATALLRIESEVKNLYPRMLIIVIPKDLSELVAAQELYDELHEEGIVISILVNNSCFGEHGLFTETSWQKEEALIITNIITVVHLTKLVLREMRLRNSGKILQVASVVGFMPSPRMAVYGATKSFILFFSEALQEEMKDTEVTLTILSPGAGDTDFFRKANAENIVADKDTKLSNPADVAEAGYAALMKGKKHEIVGFKNEQETGLSKLMPDSWSAAAMNKMFEEKEKRKNA